MKLEKYDFCGWATKNNVKCSDGRTIRNNAFAEQDGDRVPLVWQHQHNSIDNVLGHAYLENRPEGVYAYGFFNDTYMGNNARELVKHGDVNSLSIYANQLKQNGGDVVHGKIRELSLVLAGANPEALIEQLAIAHSIDDESSEALIFTEEPFELYHSEEPVAEEEPKEETNNETEEKSEEQPSEEIPEETPVETEEKPEEETEEAVETTETIEHAEKEDKTIGDVFNAMSEDKQKVVKYLIDQALTNDSVEHSEDLTESENLEHAEGTTIGDVIKSMTEEEKSVMYYLIEQALEKSATAKHSDIEEDEQMKQNVFEGTREENENVLSHDDLCTIINDAKSHRGSLKEEFLAHTAEYGIDNIEYLFPDYKNVTKTPEFVKRDMGWVSKVMGGVKHIPFSRIKSMAANITEDDARAKGYVKGNLKMEEVFGLLKRVTDPQTVYKKQKLDRDDIIDITDFDVVAWLKTEMRMMLEEELARAILVGDGRSSLSEDKINPSHIRPIYGDDTFYAVSKVVTNAAAATDEQKAKAFIKACIKARKDYKGSGVPTLFTTEDMLTDMLLIEDTTGRTIYDSVDKLATVLRVKEIVTVPVMEGLTRTVSGASRALQGIVVNLADYNVGADKGGAVNMFDDFDIDYNQEKYLMETRCSGALVKPYSAIVIESVTA